jgi:uncharacterized protein YndB with AHSA1/START domain
MTQQPFTLERNLRATPAQVWEMWTTKQGIESWWGPEGFETTVHALDVRLGGRFEFEMRAVRPDIVEVMKQMNAPLSSMENGRYLEVAPSSELDFVERFTHAPGVEPYDVSVSVTFAPSLVGTLLVIHSSGMHDERWQQLASQGWSEQLTKLERIFASR